MTNPADRVVFHWLCRGGRCHERQRQTQVDAAGLELPQSNTR